MTDAVSVLYYIFLCSHNAAFECKITHFISISPPETEKSEKMLGISQENAYLYSRLLRLRHSFLNGHGRPRTAFFIT